MGRKTEQDVLNELAYLKRQRIVINSKIAKLETQMSKRQTSVPVSVFPGQILKSAEEQAALIRTINVLYQEDYFEYLWMYGFIYYLLQEMHILGKNGKPLTFMAFFRLLQQAEIHAGELPAYQTMTNRSFSMSKDGHYQCNDLKLGDCNSDLDKMAERFKVLFVKFP